MKLDNITKHYSQMTWLDEEIKRNKAAIWRTKYSDFYYNILKKIREKQNNNHIPIDEYKLVGNRRTKLQTIEYGYYMANIHYDLFIADINEKEALENRIIFFLDNADEMLFKDDESWFRLNFEYEFLSYLKSIHLLQDINSLNEYKEKYADYLEAKIIDKLLYLKGWKKNERND